MPACWSVHQPGILNPAVIMCSYKFTLKGYGANSTRWLIYYRDSRRPFKTWDQTFGHDSINKEKISNSKLPCCVQLGHWKIEDHKASVPWWCKNNPWVCMPTFKRKMHKAKLSDSTSQQPCFQSCDYSIVLSEYITGAKGNGWDICCSFPATSHR